LEIRGPSPVQPFLDGLAGLLGQLKLDGTTSFLLDNNGAFAHPRTDAYVADLQAHEIATPQFTIDSQIE
jgi:hypothetical protein